MISLDDVSYLVVEVSGTSLVNFMTTFRETLRKLSTYPHWEVAPIDLGPISYVELLSWWRRHQIGVKKNEANCCVIRLKGYVIPTKHYHLHFDFYDGLKTDLLSIAGNSEANTPPPVTQTRHAASRTITRQYDLEEYRAFFLLKSRNALDDTVRFLGVTLDILPRDLNHENVVVLDPEDGSQSVIML